MANAIKKICWRYRFKKNLNQSRLDRDVSAQHSVGSLAVYYAYENREEWERLITFLTGLKIPAAKISVMVFDPEHALKTDTRPFALYVADEKDLRFSGMPRIGGKNDRLSGFFNAKHDVFADFSRECHGLDAAVASMVRAKIKVGKGGEWNTKACDLILQPEAGKASYVDAFAENMKRYLPILCKFEA